MMRHQITVALRLSRRQIAGLIGAIAICNLLVVLATYLFVTLGPESGPMTQYLWRQFNITIENNASVWYASMLLLTVSLAMLGCFVLDRRQSRPGRDHLLSYGWLALSAAFAGLSLDEMGSLHERIGMIDTLNVAPEGLQGWVGVFAIPIAVAGAFILGFAWFRVRRNPAAFGLMAAGVLLYLTVPVQEHLELEQELEATLRPLLEETVEIFGSLAFLSAAVIYARMLAAGNDGGRDESGGSVDFSIDHWTALATVALLAGGMVVLSHGVLPNLSDPVGSGHAPNWFPAALSFLVALTGFYVGHIVDRRTGQFRAAAPFLFLALLHLFFSIDHGSDHFLTDDLMTSSPPVRMLLDASLILGMVCVALLFSPRRVPTMARVALVGWVLLRAMALIAGEPFNAEFSLAAYGVLFMAFPMLQPEESRMPAPSGRPGIAPVAVPPS